VSKWFLITAIPNEPKLFFAYNRAPMNKTFFDLVIFDCDGVLVDSEPLANRVFVQMLREYGYTIDEASYLREFSGQTIHNRMKVASQKLNWTPPMNFLSAFHERLSALTEKELSPVDGIHALIESLPTPICVASNGSREEIVLRLKLAQLTHHFGDRIFSGLEVPHPKPAPDVYLAAANSFNIPPERCIVIEDSVPGVTAAVRAGMKVYGHAAFTPVEELRAANATPFSNMAELKSILTELSMIQFC
jgi:phosphoglycolate phosphatase